MALRTVLLVVFAWSAQGCQGCEPEPVDDDGGPGGPGADAGPFDAGDRDGGRDDDSGPPDDDGGAPNDAGPGGDDGGFDWEDIFGEAGLPDELACLPGTAPDVTGGISGVLSALDLHSYSGSPETGVVCGNTTCAADVPCCVLCGYAQCAEVPADGSDPTCPAFTLEFTCDGKEDCGGSADTCCFSLSGTQCTTREECSFDLSFLDGGLPDLFNDGGFTNPFTDAGDIDAGVNDAGTGDGGASDSGIGDSGTGDSGTGDSGTGDSDGGDSDSGTGDGGTGDGGPVDNDAGANDAGDIDAGGLDAGPPVGDILGELLDQGIKVCHSSLEFFSPSCDVFSGEVCCTSDRFVSVDIGLCVPLLVCFGGGI